MVYYLPNADKWLDSLEEEGIIKHENRSRVKEIFFVDYVKTEEEEKEKKKAKLELLHGDKQKSQEDIIGYVAGEVDAGKVKRLAITMLYNDEDKMERVYTAVSIGEHYQALGMLFTASLQWATKNYEEIDTEYDDDA